MNIQYIDHHQIDPAKWDCVVLQSPHPLVYGLFNYLNAVCDTQWDALIYNDYEAVFPLPFKKKIRPQISRTACILSAIGGVRLKRSRKYS